MLPCTRPRGTTAHERRWEPFPWSTLLQAAAGAGVSAARPEALCRPNSLRLVPESPVALVWGGRCLEAQTLRVLHWRFSASVPFLGPSGEGAVFCSSAQLSYAAGQQCSARVRPRPLMYDAHSIGPTQSEPQMCVTAGATREYCRYKHLNCRTIQGQASLHCGFFACCQRFHFFITNVTCSYVSVCLPTQRHVAA